MADTQNRKSSRSFNLSKHETRRFDLSKHDEEPADEGKQGGSKKWLWAVLGGALLIGGAVYFLNKGDGNSDTPQNEVTSQQTATQPAQQQAVAEVKPVEQQEEIPSQIEANTDAQTPSATETRETEQPSSKSEVSSPTTSTPVTSKPEPSQPASNISEALGDIETEAQNVWRGKYGSGQERKQKLGSRYREVQDMVNKMYYNK